MLTRRELGLGIASLSCSRLVPAYANEVPDTRVAIVDMSVSSIPWIDQLQGRGVQAVARYYARAKQDNFVGKRLIDNVDKQKIPEWELLLRNKIAIISVYQYDSSSRSKFLRDFSSTPERERKRANERPAPNSCAFDKESAPNREAFLDAQAARHQAKMVGQPDESPIYFGADFNLDAYKWETYVDQEGKTKWKHSLDERKRKIKSMQLTDAVYNYFHKLNCLLGDRLGVYGNGYTCNLLKSAGLVTHTWISESRSFEETPKFLRGEDWNMFQNRIDKSWFYPENVCSTNGDVRRLELDTDIQNPNRPLGSWGAPAISQARTEAIYAARLVARTNVPVFSEPREGSPRAQMVVNAKNEKKKDILKCVPSTAERNRTVRLLRDLGEWLELDVDDDGKVDGYCKRTAQGQNNFVSGVRRMPDY
jgi:hypothetical protein